jgi:transposase
MNVVATLGIDLAKQVFSVHGVGRDGKTVLQRTIRRDQLADLVANLPPCLIGVEHDVRLMAPRFIGAYRKGEKNDGNDAEAICEAETCQVTCRVT